MECRHCGGIDLVRFGIVSGKQRFKCKDCGRSTRENDGRVKYPPGKRLRVLKMYLENVGIRSIERLEDVPSSLIIKWIRRSAEFMSELLMVSAPAEKPEDVEIMEMDDLCSFVKKKQRRIFVWTAADRNKGRIADFEVSESLGLPAYGKIAGRLKKRFRIRFLCTDGNYTYDNIKRTGT
jgi:transposase-like protein